MDLGFLFPLLLRQQVDLDVGVGGAADVHGRQVAALQDVDDQHALGEVVLNLKFKVTIQVPRRGSSVGRASFKRSC